MECSAIHKEMEVETLQCVSFSQLFYIFVSVCVQSAEEALEKNSITRCDVMQYGHTSTKKRSN